MESKEAMVFLQDEMPNILQYGGRVPLWETCNTMRAYSKHENATLTAEHRLMKEALEKMKDAKNLFSAIVIAEGTLKNITL